MGEGTSGEGQRGAPGSGPDPLHLGDCYSAFLPTLICRWSPHISESAFFSDRRGAALAAWLRGLGCLTTFPHVEEPS